MPIRRLARVPLTAGVVVALAATLLAQFPKVRVPKLPGLPNAPSTTPPQARKAAYCDGITSDQIEQFLKALNAEQAALDRQLAAAKAKKAEADQAQQARGQRVVADMMKTADCKDPIKERDPRTREAERLQKLADDASARGDDTKADEYQKQASALNDGIDIDADRACGGKGSSLYADCKAKFITADPRTAEADRLRRQASEAAKHGDKKTSDALTAQAAKLIAMRDVDAHGQCLPQMVSAQLGAGAEEEQRASDAASSDMGSASSKAEKEAAEKSGFTEDEYARLKECIQGRLTMPGGPPMDDTSAKAIDAHKAELKKALKL